jgi:hypothetical protein
MATGQVGEYPVGSLVRIRERDWIVLPSDDAEILCLRPQSLPTRYRLQSRQCIRIHGCLEEVTVFSHDCHIPSPYTKSKISDKVLPVEVSG